MAGPWERYQQQAKEAPAAEGPWAKYQAKAEPTPQSAPAAFGPALPSDVAMAQAVRATQERDQDSLLSVLRGDPGALKRRGQEAQAYAALTPEERSEVAKGFTVAGEVPLVTPAGAVPRLARAATALSEGKGLGYLLGRTALSTGQGAVMSAVDGRKEGESVLETADRAYKGAKLSGGVQLAAEGIPVVGKLAGATARKIGSAISGVDEGLIQNYASRTDEVNDLIKQSGGDVTAAADQVRTELSAGIQRAKQALNGKITAALRSASPEATISIQPIIDRLQAAKANLNPNFKASAIAEIDEMIAAIGREAKDGNVNASSLYQIKQFLNEFASGAYQKPGQIFNRAGEAARAAKDAATEARAQLKPVAGAISEADGQLSRLHAIERRLNKNLLAPGKPDGALLAAGSGANARNAANLRALEEVSGVPVTQRAKDLATARTFANPSLTPSDFTGKAAARVLAAGGIGYATGGAEGAAVAGALASPMALKAGINTINAGRHAVSGLPNVARAVRENPVVATAATQLTAKQIREANQKPEDVPAPSRMLGGEPREANGREPSSAPKGGPERWARTGLERLGLKGSPGAEKLLRSAEGRRLLIEASDLKPGSPRLMKIREQIQKGKGKR